LKRLAVIFILFLLLPKVGASTSEWFAKTYGGSGNDVINDVKVLSDESIIAVGYTNSTGAGGGDVLVMKLSPSGEVEWAKTYGGSGDDVANALAIAPNGDVIVAGYTWSFGAGYYDAWILRLPPGGEMSGNICSASNAHVSSTKATVGLSNGVVELSQRRDIQVMR